MQQDESKIFEKMYGKKVATEKLNIEGYKQAIPFDIYDGYAICPKFRGHRYDMTYPQMKAVKDSKELSDAIVEYCGLNNADEITVIHVLITFNTFYEDGVEIEAK